MLSFFNFLQNSKMNKCTPTFIHWVEIFRLEINSFLLIIALEVTKVVGFGSNIPCAAKFNSRLLFWKIFRGNRSKMAGCKLQLVLFYSFLYNKLIPESTFFILPQDCPKRHLPTWNTWKALSALMFNVKNPNRLWNKMMHQI